MFSYTESVSTGLPVPNLHAVPTMEALGMLNAWAQIETDGVITFHIREETNGFQDASDQPTLKIISISNNVILDITDTVGHSVRSAY